MYQRDKSAEWLTVMDCTAQGVFVLVAELSLHAQLNENSRYCQLEVISRGEKPAKNTLWGKDKENSSLMLPVLI